MPVSRSRPSSPGRATRRCGCTAPRSSRSRPRSPPASASGSCATTARASPGPGSLDADVVAETLGEARDNAAFAEPDECVGLAEPDGVAPVPFDPFDPAVAALRPRAQDRARPRARGAGSAPATLASPACGSRPSPTPTGRAAVATSTGIAAAGRSACCSMGVLALAADGDETYTGSGSTVALRPDELDLDEAVGDAVDAGDPPVRRPRRCRRSGWPSCSSPAWRPPSWACSAATLTGDRVLKGRSPFADRVGDADRRARRSPSSTTPPITARSRPRCSTARAWPAAATCSSTAACSRASSTTAPDGSAGRPAQHRLGRPGRVVHPGRRVPGARRHARRRHPRRAGRRRRRPACSCSR